LLRHLPRRTLGDIAAPALVQPARVLAVQPSEGLGERRRPLGNGDQMDVVRHQAVAEQAHAGAGGVGAQQSAVAVAVVNVEGGLLAVVAPLREMVRFAHRHHPRESGHGIVALSAYHSLGSPGLKSSSLSESAGINRRGVGDERAPQRRSSEPR